MGWFDFLRKIFGFGRAESSQGSQTVADAPLAEAPVTESSAAESPSSDVSDSEVSEPAEKRKAEPRPNSTVPRPDVHLRPLDYVPSTVPIPPDREIVSEKPYRFAVPAPRTGEFLDLSRDSDERWLEYYGLPRLKTPDDLADWLGVTTGTLAWLTHRFREGHRPSDERDSHYHYRWIAKRSEGWRLIEAPKSKLKDVQTKILRGILDSVPAHSAAHGFVPGRSIVSNATPHSGSKFILKMDLEDFYPTVRYSRVVAIYRSLGFSREVSLWLARLSVSALPWSLKSPVSAHEYVVYTAHHLPQGAPTSPALANLSAYGLDIRLAGMANAYRIRYTRYADDLTFSGPGLSIPALNEFIPLAKKIIREERFTMNRRKLKVIRNSQRQIVTGVVVNEKTNVSRKEFDQLKAILYNCIKHGPQSQNRAEIANFAEHLRGRIAHISQLNPRRGAKLMRMYSQIGWT
ncbi:Reverse transcriptase (RNA-dependent DNA polymerase) [Thalassoglobus neptunius]|uniref:RNA-directed DNA polymerase n=1 Tax=Thalassoglobus neptunius TaxID=1938619 RepID=A0A5C5X0K9_9PLAN|nr:reverse transcriptase family protein [Thalassoglobus neptunius]TWT55821.1 Reverse transcriptase (RNA-dependent DNA polymerase) [Thalassoglobus neptunius]